jgi:guanylate kinase
MKKTLLGNLKKGLLFVISAPAETGKTTLASMLAEEFSCVVQSISFTTRMPREGEINGVHYNFLTMKEFEKRIATNEFLEYAQIYGDYYGTSANWVEQQCSQGKHVMLVIDTQGALLIKDKRAATLIFIMPPSLDELRQRLMMRKTESSNVIEKRLEWAKHELEVGKVYDFIIVNDELSVAYQVLRSILISEEHRNINQNV